MTVSVLRPPAPISRFFCAAVTAPAYPDRAGQLLKIRARRRKGSMTVFTNRDLERVASLRMN